MRDIASLRVFVQIVECGSFATASEKLNLSPSSVSKQFQALEASLKAKLLHRSTHGISLTEAGRLFFARSKSILAEIDSARDEIVEINNKIVGKLKIHVTPTVGQQVVIPLLSEFLRDHPDLTVDVVMRPQRVDLIGAGIDLSIHTGWDDDRDLKYSSIQSRRLGWARHVICAAPSYLMKHGRPANPRDLRNHNCLIYSSQPSANEWWFKDGNRPYSVIVSGQMVADDWAAIKEATLRGVGIARFLAVEIETLEKQMPRVEVLFEEAPVSRRAILAFYPRTSHLPRKVTALLDFLAGRIPE